MNAAAKNLQSILGGAVDLILPPRCVVTGQLVERQGMIAQEAWRKLDFIAAPFCDCCGVPFEFEVGSGALCASCQQKKPPYETARAALVYDSASRDMILRFKHADQTHLIHSFMPWLQRAGADMLAQADYLVPVPLHRFRLIRRRYNQAAMIAAELAGWAGKPCLVDALERRRPTVPQGHMNYSQRKKNVSGAFVVNLRHASKLTGKTVVLIDDVYTTGSTVKECARVLKRTRVAAVHVLALARVVRSDYRA